MVYTYPSWMRRTQARPDLRLFCLPYAGGGSSMYLPWSRSFPPGIEVFPVLLPGREIRLAESPLTDINQLVAQLAEELAPYLDVPYAIFGYSLGALLGFELARCLRRQGMGMPRHFFAAARVAPQAPRPATLIHTLDDTAFLAEIRRLRGTPEGVLQNEELMTLLLPILRADFTLNEAYCYQDEEPLACPITVLTGTGDSLVTPEMLALWRVHTQARYSLIQFPGDHFFLNAERDHLIRVLLYELQR